MNIDDPATSRSCPRQAVELDRVAAMNLLAGAGVGRIVFTEHALPAIQVVNHVVDNGEIIIRTDITSALADTMSNGIGIVVAYEADDIDPTTRLGWSVVATGIAGPVSDADRVASYQALLQPWVSCTKDMVISMRPQIVTGFQLAERDDGVAMAAEPAMPPTAWMASGATRG